MAMTPKERTKFIQDAMITSFVKMVVTKPDLDLLFYWMFYQKSMLENQFKISTSPYVKEINAMMDKMPRDLQLNIIMKIMKDQTQNHSKTILGLLKLYKN